MKKWCPTLILTGILIMSAGCAKTQNRVQIPRDAATMEVAFSWEGIPPCTHESPEISVSHVPEETAALRVTLADVNVPEWNHGGGTVKHDGSGIIRAGALKLGYNGPCPPSGRHTYEFSVMALNAEGVIIGFGKARQSFPPKK